MLQVYLDPITVNSRKVLAGLDLMGTEFEFHHIDYFAGHHKLPEYLKINPHATVSTNSFSRRSLLTADIRYLQLLMEIAISPNQIPFSNMQLISVLTQSTIQSI